MNHIHSHGDTSWGNASRGRWALIGLFALAAAFLLGTPHRAHLLGALPFLLLLACPLMHLFHGGHGAHGHDAQPGDSGRTPGPGASS